MEGYTCATLIKSKILKYAVHPGTYSHLTFSNGMVIKYPLVHRLVALTFISNPENKEEVNHIDFNRQNNNVENLEWVTRKENVERSYEAGRHIRGEKSHFARLTEDQVRRIRELNKSGRAVCKIFGVTDYSIRQVLTRGSWKHI